MNHRQRTSAVLNYQAYDRLPIVHFGFLRDTLRRWADEGHISHELAEAQLDSNAADLEIGARLGFDFNWQSVFSPAAGLWPPFEHRVLEETPDGWRKVLTGNGVVILEKDDARGIPPELDHLLKGRAEWDAHFAPRMKFTTERVSRTIVRTPDFEQRLDEGGRAYLQANAWARPLGLHCGSLYGWIRNWLGVIGSAYIQADDPALFDEMIDTVGESCYRCTEIALELAGPVFDFGHFWEDICFKNGPLINPRVFRKKVGPHYRRITDLLRQHGITLVSLDCDGWVDALVPIWLENGVNVMFPIEVGTWNASIAPWRAKYGRELRGIGGMRKYIFAQDYAAVDAEVERLKALVDLGGYIPCPDHRLPADCKWENVQYYCEKLRKAFGG
jgi:uroporphyrinogen decarboxylase